MLRCAEHIYNSGDGDMRADRWLILTYTPWPVCAWTLMLDSCHSTAVVLRLVRYLQLQAGRLVCQQILFLEIRRERKQLFPDPSFPPVHRWYLTSFCSFAHRFVSVHSWALLLFFFVLCFIYSLHSLSFHPCHTSLLLTFVAVCRQSCLFIWEDFVASSTVRPTSYKSLLVHKGTLTHILSLSGSLK